MPNRFSHATTRVFLWISLKSKSFLTFSYEASWYMCDDIYSPHEKVHLIWSSWSHVSAEGDVINHSLFINIQRKHSPRKRPERPKTQSQNRTHTMMTEYRNGKISTLTTTPFATDGYSAYFVGYRPVNPCWRLCISVLEKHLSTR